MTNSKHNNSILIHSTSLVDNGAIIGANTKIWHWSHVCSGAQIGENCSLGQNVFVGNKVKIGENTKIQNNVSIFDNVIIEKNVFCGPSMVFTNVYNPRSEISRKDEYRKTLVREGATMGANCTIICGITIGKYSFIGPNATLCGGVSVGECSFIGAGATILPYIKIGKNCMIGAGSVVTKDIPDNVTAYGNPAKIK